MTMAADMRRCEPGNGPLVNVHYPSTFNLGLQHLHLLFSFPAGSVTRPAANQTGSVVPSKAPTKQPSTTKNTTADKKLMSTSSSQPIQSGTEEFFTCYRFSSLHTDHTDVKCQDKTLFFQIAEWQPCPKRPLHPTRLLSTPSCQYVSSTLHTRPSKRVFLLL